MALSLPGSVLLSKKQAAKRLPRLDAFIRFTTVLPGRNNGVNSNRYSLVASGIPPELNLDQILIELELSYREAAVAVVP